MYFGDHEPPHFHAEYGDDEAMIDICPDVLRYYCELGRVCTLEELNLAFEAEINSATDPMMLKDNSN
jgi:hypothetical protein